MKCALLRYTLIAGVVATGCKWQPDEKDDPHGVPKDVEAALAALPEAQVLDFTDDGMPLYIVGDLGQAGAVQTDDGVAADLAIRPMTAPVLAAFRLQTGDLALRHMNTDDLGNRHFRYTQKFNGLDVIGGDLVVHVDVKGDIFSVNGTARGDVPSDLGRNPISQSAAVAGIFNDNRFRGLQATSSREVYIQTANGELHKAYEAIVEGSSGANPVRDKVYVDQDTGAILADYPQIYFSENRKVYNLNHGTSLPGTLARSEGQGATGETEVDGAYDGTGNTWAGYHTLFNRDSYDNAGGVLTSSVHYSTNYCNAYWDGTQMVYGDGDASQGCGPLARAQDVTAHELTHGVTQNESNLNYSGESGGMNEHLSDSSGGAVIEQYVAGGSNGTLTVTANSMLIGEEVIAPFLRNMCDPAADGSSLDYWTSSAGSVDVHYSSGIGNLMYCLLVKGGTHPRGKSTVMVPAIGADKAAHLLYKSNVDILTSNANYAAYRTAMTQAASQLGYDQATQDAVGCAFAAVGVGTAPSSCGGGGGGGGGGDGTLTNNTPITGISGTTGQQQFWQMTVPSGQTTLTFTISGGTGDADMYVQFNNKPTLSNYQCRPYVNGNAETCTITNPQAGTWWVMLNGYATFSGVTLKGVYTNSGGGGGGGGGGGDPYLTNGVPVTNISGAKSSNQYWRITTPSAKKLTVKISGGTGDADLYTRFGSRPTTSTYTCRPYVTGNNETCTVNSTSAGDYYIMLRGYTAYSGVSLIASF